MSWWRTKHTRRALLDPCQALTDDNPAGIVLARELLDWSLTPPLTERHLTLFGRAISSIAAQDPQQAVALLQGLFTAPAIDQLGQGARRDLARHLRAPVRDIFAFGDRPVWLSMLAMTDNIDYRLARAIVETALEKRALELADELEQMRQAPHFHGDLRKLIFTWKHHHERSEGGQEWHGSLHELGLTNGPDQWA